MRPRKLSLDGADVRFLLSIPPKNSKVVMQADFLVANVTLDTKLAAAKAININGAGHACSQDQPFATWLHSVLYS
jgi:hypothetical protein